MTRADQLGNGPSVCTSRASKFLSVVLTLLCVIVLGAGKEFVVWNQILEIVHENPFEMLNNMQAHALRFSLMYPVLFLSEVMKLQLDYVFSVAVLGMLILIGLLTARIASLIMWDSENAWIAYYPVTLFVLASVSTFMNGRIVFAFLGATMILIQQIRLIRSKSSRPILNWSIQALGLYLMSVSSGAFIVGVFMIALYLSFFVWGKRHERFRGTLTAIVAIGAFGLIASPWIVVYVAKNLEFYDGSFVGMLEHGPGKILVSKHQDLYAFLIPSIPLACILIFHSVRFTFQLYSKNIGLAPLVMGMGVSACIGLFGYSTFLSVILPGTVIFIAALCPFGVRFQPIQQGREVCELTRGTGQPSF